MKSVKDQVTNHVMVQVKAQVRDKAQVRVQVWGQVRDKAQVWNFVRIQVYEQCS